MIIGFMQAVFIRHSPMVMWFFVVRFISSASLLVMWLYDRQLAIQEVIPVCAILLGAMLTISAHYEGERYGPVSQK